MQQREVGFDIQTTALLKRGNEIDRKLKDIERVKVQDVIVQDTLAKRNEDEAHIHDVWQAAEEMRKDLLEAAKRQEEMLQKRAHELEEDFLLKRKLQGGKPEEDENVMHVEDGIDMDKLKAHLKEVDGCEPLKDNWVRECLVNNLTQIVHDLEEIHHIRALPKSMEYTSHEDNYQHLVVMSMTHDDKLLTVYERKMNLVQRIREKVVFRMRAAEEQFR